MVDRFTVQMYECGDRHLCKYGFCVTACVYNDDNAKQRSSMNAALYF